MIARPPVILIYESQLRLAGQALADVIERGREGDDDFPATFKRAALLAWEAIRDLADPDPALRGAPVVLVEAESSARGGSDSAEARHRVPPRPMLIGVPELARMLHISRKTLDEWRSRGKVPPPIIVEHDERGRPRLVRWSLAQIERWIADGCPEEDDSPVARVRRRRGR